MGIWKVSNWEEEVLVKYGRDSTSQQNISTQ